MLRNKIVNKTLDSLLTWPYINRFSSTLIAQHAKVRQWFFCERRVSVLELNLALDSIR